MEKAQEHSLPFRLMKRLLNQYAIVCRPSVKHVCLILKEKEADVE